MPLLVPILLGAGGLAVLALLACGRVPALASDVRAALLTKMNEFAKARVPYKWGGRDPGEGLDCSGAVEAAVIGCGFAPRSFFNYSADGLYRKVCGRISEAEVGAGDLVFYGTPSRVTHVMMAVGDGRVIGATGGDSSTTTEAAARAIGAEVKIKPMAYRKDVVGFGRLPIAAKALA